jgi:hypothetical protein
MLWVVVLSVLVLGSAGCSVVGTDCVVVSSVASLQAARPSMPMAATEARTSIFIETSPSSTAAVRRAVEEKCRRPASVA